MDDTRGRLFFISSAQYQFIREYKPLLLVAYQTSLLYIIIRWLKPFVGLSLHEFKFNLF